MNTKLRKEAKHDFEKDFVKLMNNSVSRKTIQNVRKYRYIKLVTTNKKRNQNLIAIEMKKKTKVKMNKPIYLDMSSLDISKTLMYEFWYDYIKPKYQDRAKLCYMNTDSFVIHLKTEDFYEDIADDVEKWFDTSNYSKDDNRLLFMFKNCEDCLFNYTIILMSQQRFNKSNHHNVSTDQINKIALSSKDDKRLQTFGKIMMHPYGTNAFKIC